MKTLQRILIDALVLVPVAVLGCGFAATIFYLVFARIAPSSPLANYRDCLIGAAIAGSMIGLYAAIRGDKFGKSPVH